MGVRSAHVKQPWEGIGESLYYFQVTPYQNSGGGDLVLYIGKENSIGCPNHLPGHTETSDTVSVCDSTSEYNEMSPSSHADKRNLFVSKVLLLLCLLIKLVVLTLMNCITKSLISLITDGNG